MFIDLYDSQYSDLIALVKLFLSPMQRMSGLSCIGSMLLDHCRQLISGTLWNLVWYSCIVVTVSEPSDVIGPYSLETDVDE